MTGILKRKTLRSFADGEVGQSAVDPAWRLALSRALRDQAGLQAEITRLTQRRCGLSELLELPPERALISLLDGPEGGIGMLALSPEVSGALVEMQTVGRVNPGPIPSRRATRTDAAMAAPMIDRALIELDAALQDRPDAQWAGGFRYASHLDDPRLLGLLLEDQPYRLLSLTLSMSDGLRQGKVLLALPAQGRGAAMPEAAVPDPQPAFSSALEDTLMLAQCSLKAVLARQVLPLAAVLRFAVGDLLPLGAASLEQITLRGTDGRDLAIGRLGQQRGLRALRMADLPGETAATAAPPRPEPQSHDAGLDYPGMSDTGMSDETDAPDGAPSLY